ncbi:MAG: hypothetical protein FJ405_16090 [Verrucomicrobia bacterium]|nr:hypothetical protein [Verrucomicrobiota bacterium]
MLKNQALKLCIFLCMTGVSPEGIGGVFRPIRRTHNPCTDELWKTTT